MATVRNTTVTANYIIIYVIKNLATTCLFGKRILQIHVPLYKNLIQYILFRCVRPACIRYYTYQTTDEFSQRLHH